MTMGAGLRPGTKAPESPPDPNVGAPAPDSTTSCSRLYTGTGTGFGPLTWRRAARSDGSGARCTLPTAQSTRSIEQDELGTQSGRDLEAIHEDFLEAMKAVSLLSGIDLEKLAEEFGDGPLPTGHLSFP